MTNTWRNKTGFGMKRSKKSNHFPDTACIS